LLRRTNSKGIPRNNDSAESRKLFSSSPPAVAAPLSGFLAEEDGFDFSAVLNGSLDFSDAVSQLQHLWCSGLGHSASCLRSRSMGANFCVYFKCMYVRKTEIIGTATIIFTCWVCWRLIARSKVLRSALFSAKF
jgi:hypothetical protein